MSDVLDYASPTTKPYVPGWGFSLLILLNGLSLGFILLVVAMEAISKGNGLIGDSYGPIIGVVIGIPYILAQFFFGTLPAIIYATRFKAEASRRLIVTLVVVSILALLGVGSFTAACILAPRTHGTTC